MATTRSGNTFSPVYQQLNTFGLMNNNEWAYETEIHWPHAKRDKLKNTIKGKRHETLIMWINRIMPGLPQSGNKCNSIVDSMEL